MIASALLVFASLGTNVGAPIGDVRIYGPVADRMEKMIRNHVTATDPCYLSHPFHSRTETAYFHSEFWGKYMHAAPYFWKYTGCEKLKANIERGVRDMISTQTPDGYLGYYGEEKRLEHQTWDVWGCKYTMMGLITWYDVSGDKAALDAAAKLCDYLIAWFDPKAGHTPLHATGWVSGLASCSILEPVVWLYERTKEPRFLEFAKYVLAESAADNPDGDPKMRHSGPELLASGAKGVPVAGRSPYNGAGRHNRRKAYEMMSCYQGYLDYYEATGDEKVFRAALNSANDIITNEVNLAGSGAVREYWYYGQRKQHLSYMKNQETCVTTTWMRLLEKLLALTGDPKYADEIERSFYNAFLGALNRDGSFFATYTPLGGYRCGGQNHCFMFTNCCNANGPRGFLVFLEALLRAKEDAAIVNFYNAANASIVLPANKLKVLLDMYTLYPKEGNVKIWNRTKGENEFSLMLRIPAWSEKTVVKVNGKAIVGKPVAGTYFDLRRTWKEGDCVDIDFDMTVRPHLLDHAIAFTSGPVLLARDNRFNDGDVGEVVRYDVINANHNTPWLEGTEQATPPLKYGFKTERTLDPAMWMVWSCDLPIGSHWENPDGRRFTTVRFCDYASAGNAWSPLNYYRTWLPVEYMPWE